MKQRWVCTTPTDNSTLPVWFHSAVRHLEKISLWRMDLSHNPLTLRPIRAGRDMSLLPDKDSPRCRGGERLWGGCTSLASLQSPGICAISSVKMCLDTASRDTAIYQIDNRSIPLPEETDAWCWVLSGQGPSLCGLSACSLTLHDSHVLKGLFLGR